MNDTPIRDILTIIQARFDSTRLPGKVLMQMAGKTMLEHVYDAAPEPKVIAITYPEQELFDFCLEKGLSMVRCYVDSNDVLGRFVESVGHMQDTDELSIKYVLRLTADCPMLRQEHVKKFLSFHKLVALTENSIFTNRPCDADGYDMELFSVRALLAADENSTDAYDREHVTPWLYRHLHVIRVPIINNMLWTWPLEKVSVDTPEEFEYVKQLMEEEQV